MHSHTSQLQVSPSQTGHLQTSQPHAAAVVDAFAVQQFIEGRGEVVVDFACRQAQLPHSQTSQLQTPVQSGHLQSIHPQADFA